MSECDGCGRRRPGRPLKLNPNDLSRRESEIVSYVIRGKKSKVIGETLFITEKTVKFHLTNVYKKLKVTDRAELISGWYMGLFTEEQRRMVNVYLPQPPPPPPEPIPEVTLAPGNQI